MQKSRKFMVSRSSFAGQVRGWLMLGGLALVNVGCANYTKVQLCNEKNAAHVAGVTGVYEISMQNHNTFEVSTQEVRVGVDEKGLLSVRSAIDEDDKTGYICNVGGQLVFDSFDKKLGAYQQWAFYVTNAGLSFAPIAYNRPALEAAGIHSEIFVMPESVRAVLGERLSKLVGQGANRIAQLVDDDQSKGMLIDNTTVSNEALMLHAKPMPGMITYYRR